MTAHKIFMGMDVLCDFVQAALELHGRPDVIDDWPKGEYDMAKILGMSTHEFWRPINDKGEAFWAEMKSTAYSHELLMLTQGRGGFRVAASPSEDPASLSGKLKWLDRHFGPPCRYYVITPDKHLLAGPDRILIDDSDKQIDTWQRAGGIGILFPAKWNAMHLFHADPMEFVRFKLKKLEVTP